MRKPTIIVGALALLGGVACGGGSANELGVGAECQSTDDCTEDGQQCLFAFRGGYCGVEDCTADVDCPDGSACIAHTDGVQYCFLVCDNKPDCNRNRTVDNESNCSSNVTFTDGTQGRKACVPPSG